jgi:hypothetical protein
MNLIHDLIKGIKNPLFQKEDFYPFFTPRKHLTLRAVLGKLRNHDGLLSHAGSYSSQNSPGHFVLTLQVKQGLQHGSDERKKGLGSTKVLTKTHKGTGQKPPNEGQHKCR